MIVRRERPTDRPVILDVIRAAFRKDSGEPTEVGLTQKLFDDGYLPELSLVAVTDGQIVGYVIGTVGCIGDTEAIGIGPLAVLPEFQGRGVGQALMYALIGASEALHERVLALLGEPEYYSRFGFRAGSEVGVKSPDSAWGDYFQALQLTDGPVNGEFQYAKPFDEL
ncbi:GNAT family N-acetyltransferase [Rhodococcoides yunnanense]|uniref:GNAT family N-acetyltransferase n=1 Tax=Rhodococcoides yunnanense TaxID=278209 RepID=UPI001FEBC29C|nr:N-acetyltransferase [Rhodococcus yunnanensis]